MVYYTSISCSQFDQQRKFRCLQKKSEDWWFCLMTTLLPNSQVWRLIAGVVILKHRAEILISEMQLNMRTTPHFCIKSISMVNSNLRSKNKASYPQTIQSFYISSLRIRPLTIKILFNFLIVFFFKDSQHQALSTTLCNYYHVNDDCDLGLHAFYYQNVPDDHSHHSCIYTYIYSWVSHVTLHISYTHKNRSTLSIYSVLHLRDKSSQVSNGNIHQISRDCSLLFGVCGYDVSGD